MFHVGQKVECINDRPATPKDRYWAQNWPVRGGIYVVRGLTNYHRGVGLYLVELTNQPIVVIGFPHKIEPNFLATRFRPVVERKTDISIFTRMLTPEPVQ